MTSEPTGITLHATWAGPAAAALLFVWMTQSGASTPIALTAAITLWTASWWVFEPVPIPVASLLPIALFPVLGILTPTQVGAAYGSPLILLLLGGFILSQGMRRSGVHRRIALMLLTAFGGTSRAMVFGFLVAAGMLSMWISNTATALMLLPIALAALEPVTDRRIHIGVLLAVAYGCSIGSLGTPIGTPPNLVFIEVYQQTTGNEFGFTDFMRAGLPVVALMLPVAGLILIRGMPSVRVELPEKQGPWRSAEIRTLGVFGVTALLWITRREPFGGWSGLLGLDMANDASVALLAVVAMFLIPSGTRKHERLLDWNTAADIPWGILLLFGSGICIARAFVETGLSGLIGDAIAQSISSWPLLLTLVVVCLTVTFLTEMVSNTATTTLLMPILAAAGIGAGIDPQIIMLPAAMSASCAFMLPVATGPNAVVFGSGRIRVIDMARKGILLNVAGVAVIVFVNYWRLN